MLRTYNSIRENWPAPAGSESLSLRSVAKRLADTEDGFAIPDYQRGHVWTDTQSSQFLAALCEGLYVPPVFIQRWVPYRKNLPDEILDGLQRLTAISRFVANEIPIEFFDGETRFLHEFSDMDQKLLTGFAGPVVTINYVQCPTRAEVLALYIRINRGGTPHADEEIQRVQQMLHLSVSGQ